MGGAVSAHRRQILVLAPVAVLAVWAALWVAVNTTHSVITGPDSAVYLGTASELRSGHGPTVPAEFYATVPPHTAVSFGGHDPSSIFPPGYPLTLAAVSATTGGVRSAARVLDVIVMFVNVMLIGVLAARMTAYRSAFIAVLPALLVVLVPDGLAFEWSWMELHLSLMSEPLFTALAAGALIATGSALRSPQRRTRQALVLATVFASGALLTRYVGLAVVLTVCAALVLLGGDDRLRNRVARAFAVAGVALVPTLAVLLWSAALGGSGRGKLAFHPAHDYGRLFTLFGHDFLPIRWPSAVQTTGVIIITVVVVAAAIRLPSRAQACWSNDEHGTTQLRIALLFVGLYLAVVVWGRTFVDVSTSLDARLFAPVRGIVCTIVVAVLYRLLVPYLRGRGSATLLGLIVAGLVIANWSVERARLDRGIPPTATQQAIAALPRDAVLVTNVPDRVYLTVGRGSFLLPDRNVFTTGKPNDAFDAQLEEWGGILAARGGYAFFGPQFVPIANVDDLRRVVPLVLVSQSEGESLYKVSRAGG